MTIATNSYLEIRESDDGKRLYGKCGYQTMHPKVDKYTMVNLAAIERALDAGLLTDLDGNPVKDGAVIQVFMHVRKVKEGDAIDQIGSLRTATGEAISVPTPDADAEGDNPF